MNAIIHSLDEWRGKNILRDHAVTENHGRTISSHPIEPSDRWKANLQSGNSGREGSLNALGVNGSHALANRRPTEVSWSEVLSRFLDEIPETTPMSGVT
jgi:hypothetical protein